VLHALDHVVLAVGDLDAATDTYTRLLGLRPSWRGEHARFGTANTLFRLRNTYLELLAPAGDGPIARVLAERLEREGEGLFALAFGTDDALKCAEAFRGRGLPAPEPAEGEGVDSATGSVRRWRNVVLSPENTRGPVLFAIEHLTPPELLPHAEPIVDRSAAVEGLDHVVVMTGDPERSKELYGDRLGLRLALDRSFPERGVRLLFFRVGGITVELAARNDEADPDAPDRLWGLAYRVPDVVAGRQRLAQEGVDVTETRSGHKPGTRVCTVREGTLGVPTLLIGTD
jgi:catechol 2,3-dioxygenase-like lactoylglutathione lyase family enzyme